MVRAWSRIHRSSSLVCTAFLLLLCVTGLPLIFSAEIDRLLDRTHYAALATGAPHISLDRHVADARRLHPDEVVVSAFADDEAPAMIVRMAPSFSAVAHARFVRFDVRTGALLGDSRQNEVRNRRFTSLMLALHRGLFAGLAGELFLGAMALLFLLAIVSGVVLYGPFTRRIDFGTVRLDRTRRVRWLDLHNLLGVVTLAWVLVVGATGLMNELATPLFAFWQQTNVAAMLEPYRGRAPIGSTAPVSPQAAVDTALHALPGMSFFSVGFPGGRDGSAWHYMVWTKGGSALTGRLFSPVLVDARTGKVSAVLRMPWYLRALEISRPLHFGDYGGLPLKILWALFDLVTIIVLSSGLYLWITKRQRAPA